MKALNTISAAVVGTTAMTLFSYLFSKKEKKNYVEPEVMGKVIKNYAPEVKKENSKLAAWPTHYAVGVLFASAYDTVWENTPVKPSILSGAVLGAASGVVGIAGWSQMFNLSDSAPVEDKNKYYRHLMVAHVIFGIGAAIGYKLFDNTKDTDEQDF